MIKPYDVIVVGGGVVGLSAAIAMRQRGFSVALLDASALSADLKAIDSRVYAINASSQQLLETMGVWNRMDGTRLSPYERMHVWDAKNNSTLDFDARMIASDRLGTIIEESVLKNALFQQLSKEDVPIISNARITSLQLKEDYCEVKNSTQKWQAKFLIVADGARSSTRDLLGVSIVTWPYNHTAIVTTVQTELPHQMTAYQVFDSDGPLAFLPLENPYHCSIVWSTTPTRVEQLMALDENEFAKKISIAFNNKLGACTLLDKRFSFPLHMRHAKRYSGASWALMGDAAHTLHPLAGLGLNVGLSDLSTFLTLLGTSRLPSTRQLAAYHRQRSFEVWKMIMLMEGLKAVFSNSFSLMVFLRGLGLQMCDGLLPLKRFLIEQAAS